MKQYIGDIIVRHEELNYYIVKVRIVNFEGRSEANLHIKKDKVQKYGINTFNQAKKQLPKRKDTVLAEINEQFPTFWDIDN